MARLLHVVMYHYVRDLPNTPFPRIKGMLTTDFQRQVAEFRSRYEMATLESALGFLRGDYWPSRDLCLLTFDDGLKEHYTDVTSLLLDFGIRGVFFPITSCIEEQRVAPVHMNHFLMASLGFESYQRIFIERLNDMAVHEMGTAEVDQATAQNIYRWDTPDVASFKYLFNFLVASETRDQITKTIFEENLSDEEAFSRKLYFSWEEARAMQREGMVIGGHSHQHKPLATLSTENLDWDLTRSRRLLERELGSQDLWSFCYPYGTKESFSNDTVVCLKRLGFSCAFTTEARATAPGADFFALGRFDCRDKKVS